jgi:hypothetical protein
MLIKSILQNISIGLLLVFLTAGAGLAQTSAITYQGKLTDNGSPATGNYEMRFRLFDQAADGFEIGTPKIIPNIAAAGGTFTVKIEVGDWTFDQNDRYLEIAVRPQGNLNPFTLLTPRQPITLAPKAIFSNAAALAGHALSADSAVDALKLGGLDAERYAQKNVNGELVAPRLENLAADPAPASAANIGRVYFNTTTNKPMVSNGTAWIDLSPAPRRIQTFSGAGESLEFVCNATTAIRSVTFTKSSAASRLRITYKDLAYAFGGPGGFTLSVAARIDGTLVGNPTAFRTLFESQDRTTFHIVRAAFTNVGYVDGVAAGTHVLTTTYGGVGGNFTCYRDSEPYLIEIEEIP